MMLTLGSLFSGIGGFELGLERAGMRCIWQSEIDPYASAVLRKHWPDIPNYGDIRNIRAGTVERPDVICGGFPCQDISNAGKRAGIDGERSGLWGEFARVIGDLRPDYVIVENVAALLGRGIERVLGDLAALGFDAEWHCIPASAVGAPHRRDRVWIVANAGREQRKVADIGKGEIVGRPSDGPWNSGSSMADADWPRLPIGEMLRRVQSGEGFANEGQNASLGSRFDWNEQQWFAVTGLGRVSHGVPSRVDRLRCLGNAIVPQVAEVIGRAIMRTA